MRRRFSAGLAAALVASSTAAAPLDAERDCRVVDLRDSSRNGAPIIGAEDVVYDETGERFFVAAFNRALEQDATADDGGLYSLPLAALNSGASRIAVSPLVIADGEPLRPHGIDVSADGQTVAVVERRSWLGPERRSRVLRLRAGEAGWQREVIADNAAFCQANDVAILDARSVLVTLDRQECSGFYRLIEDVLGQIGSSVAMIETGGNGGNLSGPVTFANGVAVTGREPGDVRFAYALTRDDEIRLARVDYPREGPSPTYYGDPEDERSVPLGAAPDNINVAPSGGLLVAAHDSLFALALHRAFRGWFAPPGGRVFHIADMAAPIAETVLAIPGEIFAGPTSAAAGGGVLLVGSATAAGVLACDWPPRKEDR